MPDVTVSIGGREFTVACQEGEEPFLTTAATILDQEAASLVEAIGRMPESRMLLMAGLMLADRTAAQEERARAAEAQLADQERRLAELGARAASAGADGAALAGLARLVEGVETMAEEAERRAGCPGARRGLSCWLDGSCRRRPCRRSRPAARTAGRARPTGSSR